jgi:hypothetical protein
MSAPTLRPQDNVDKELIKILEGKTTCHLHRKMPNMDIHIIIIDVRRQKSSPFLLPLTRISPKPVILVTLYDDMLAFLLTVYL